MLNILAVLVGGLLLWPATAGAQDLSGELAALKQEVAVLRAELAQLRADVSARAVSPPAAAPPSTMPLEVIQAQLAEQAQTKVESASRLPLKLSGSIVSTTFLNSGTPNWLEIPNINRAATGPDQGSFSSTLRQSRIGVETAGLMLGDWQASGTIVFDFFGGIPSFQNGQVMGLPRMVYAFARMEGPGGSVLVGQDDAIVAPRSPSSFGSVSFPALFRSGNLYLRVPQVRGEARLATGEHSKLRLIGGIAAPIAGDFATGEFAFEPPELAGERSERPAVQARGVWEHTRDDAHAFAFGVSGHHSVAETDVRRDTWIGAVDFDAQWGAIGVAGEGFVAEGARAFGAGVSQAQVRSRGGWLEVRVAPSTDWRVAVGAGTDRVARRIATAALKENAGGFAGVRYNWTPELAVGVEYFLLETSPFLGAARRNHNVNWTLRYDF